MPEGSKNRENQEVITAIEGALPLVPIPFRCDREFGFLNMGGFEMANKSVKKATEFRFIIEDLERMDLAGQPGTNDGDDGVVG